MKTGGLKPIVLLMVFALLFSIAFPCFAVAAEEGNAQQPSVPEEITEPPSSSDVVPSPANTAEENDTEQAGSSATEMKDESGAPTGGADDPDAVSGVPPEESVMGDVDTLEEPALSVFAMDGEVDMVQTEEQLCEWLENHREGTVYLANTITVTSSLPFYGPITIDTGPHGLVFDGGYPHEGFIDDGEGAITGVEAQITIIGEGIDPPVVEVRSLGWIFIGNWSNYLHVLNVTATGRGGVGGTAMQILEADPRAVSFINAQIMPPGQIQSFGAGAIGLEICAPFSAFCFEIRVEGANSTAVLTHDDANICFSKLFASGDGAQTVRGNGEIIVDTCLAEPAPQGENVQVYHGEPFASWYPIRKGENLFEAYNEWPPLTVSISRSSPVMSSKELLVSWDDSIDEISTNALGSTTIPGRLTSSFVQDMLPCDTQVTINVRDPDVPCISGVFPLTEDEWVDGQDFPNEIVTHIFLCYWSTEKWGAGDCTLSYSNDGGKTWLDGTNESGVMWEYGQGDDEDDGWVDDEDGGWDDDSWDSDENGWDGSWDNDWEDDWEDDDWEDDWEDDGEDNGEDSGEEDRLVAIPISMIQEGSLFRLEVEGYGISNIVCFSKNFGVIAENIGGDRFGVDRIGATLNWILSDSPDDETPGNPANPPDKPGGSYSPGTEDPENPDPADSPALPTTPTDNTESAGGGNMEPIPQNTGSGGNTNASGVTSALQYGSLYIGGIAAQPEAISDAQPESATPSMFDETTIEDAAVPAANAPTQSITAEAPAPQPDIPGSKLDITLAMAIVTAAGAAAAISVFIFKRFGKVHP